LAITEEQRHELYEGLVQLLGTQKATTLMEHLPPVGWADVATKRDLDHQSQLLRRDIQVEAAKLRDELHSGLAGLRAELRAEMHDGSTELRTEMHSGLAGLRTEMHHGSTELRTEMHDGLAGLRTEVHGVEVRFERALRDQSRTFFLGLLTANASLAGLAFAAAQLT
jgi:hypothetical protein